MDGGAVIYKNGGVLGVADGAGALRTGYSHIAVFFDRKRKGRSSVQFLPVQVNGKRAAVDLDFACGRHIRQQFHRGAASLLCRRKRRVNVGVLRGGAVDGDLRHCVFHGAVPAVLSGNAIFRRLFQYGGRFRSRSFLLLLLLHDGTALRRVLLRPRGRGQERQAQRQRHEHTQYSFFHKILL